MLNRVSDKVQSILQAAGLKVATQKYEYTSAGITHQGENAYAIIHAPRGDATEAIVLVAAWKTADDELNLNGVTLALTLARYFKSGFCVYARRDAIADSSQDGRYGPKISFSLLLPIVKVEHRLGLMPTMICIQHLYNRFL